MSVLVSAIIPTHNRLELLKKSIQSVLNQTYEEIELIVVDDASTDGTKEYCLQKNNFIYLRIEPEKSRGGNHTRNLGIKKAHGEYIAFLDDDDEWLPEKTSKQVEFLNDNPEIGLVYSGCIVRKITHDSEIEKEQYPFRKNRGNLNKRVLYTIPCLTITIMVRKELLFKVGLFDESLSFWQETELMIRLCQITAIDIIDECLSVCRVDIADKNDIQHYAGR
ncbi:hypothetical protein FACS1894163_13920 [Spirochaetia bacterium]|nr:hypothetical protein FACS1894163_13920 [Spirochaetia bacterium]